VITLTWQLVFMILGAVQLLLAALNVPGLTRWSWFPGGVLFVTLALFFRVD
jgi:hypothetical protein